MALNVQRRPLHGEDADAFPLPSFSFVADMPILRPFMSATRIDTNRPGYTPRLQRPMALMCTEKDEVGGCAPFSS